MERYFFILIIFICSLIQDSCNISKSDILEVELQKELVVSQLSDSTFLSDVRSMFLDRYLYITDYSRDEIIIIDDSLNLLKTLGRKGMGPGEFLGASHLFLYHDTITVANDSKQCIEFFDLNRHLKTINFPEGMGLNSRFKFCIKDQRIYASFPTQNNSIVWFNPVSGESDRIGELFECSTDKLTYIRNNNHLFPYRNNLIAVSDNIPIVKLYTGSGKIITEIDYSEIEGVKQRLLFIKAQRETPQSYYNLVSDAYIYKNQLYLLLYTNKYNTVYCNSVLSINIDNNLFSLEKVYHLGEGWYSSFCIGENVLWAFNANKNLVKFSINIK